MGRSLSLQYYVVALKKASVFAIYSLEAETGILVTFLTFMAIIGGLGQIQLCFAALQQNIMPGPSEKPPQVQLIHFRWEPQKQIEKSEN